jgi:hypothetical protein
LKNVFLIPRAARPRIAPVWRKLMKQLGLGIIVAIGLTLPALGQGVDPYIGTWKMNLEKSTSTDPLPKNKTITFTGEGQNLLATVEGTDAQGKPYKHIVSHIYDGQHHPVTGNPLYDTSAFTRVGNTINRTTFRNGKPVIVGQGVVVPGKTYTVTQEGIDLNNQPFRDVAVFDRQ